MDEKKLLRAQLLKKRAAMEKNVRKVLDEKIYNNLCRHEKIIGCRKFLVYASSPAEADTRRFIETMLGKGAAVAVPRCVGKEMRFFRIDSLSQLKKGSFGVDEPDEYCREEIFGDSGTVCITPGLAFDRRGFRIGYGGGFYDRFLKDFAGHSIGICYDSFFYDELPTYSSDISVDETITDKGKGGEGFEQGK